MAMDGFKAPYDLLEYKQRTLKGRIDKDLRWTFGECAMMNPFIYLLTIFDYVFIFIAFVRSMPTVFGNYQIHVVRTSTNNELWAKLNIYV